MVTNYSPAQKEYLLLAGQHFRSLREEQGLSQEALADKCGIERSYLGKMENGVQNSSLLKLKQLADGLGVEPSRLLDFPNSVTIAIEKE